LIELLNRGVHPVVPRYGTISVGDLPQLSHLALPLLGEGEAEFRGERLSGAEALQRAGLAPVQLGAKDGLALISANSATVARAALVLDELRTLLDNWLAVVALSFEGFRANVGPLDARVIEARPAPGQAEVAQQLRRLLEGSALHEPGAARRVQDPLSFRCVAQVHGAAAWMFAQAASQVEIELNAAADSPLVLAADGVMLSNGNFHVPALAIAFDALAIALAQVVTMAVERTIKFMSPMFTDLPLQLTRRGPAHSGFATTQKTMTVMANEIRLRANPASLDFLSVSERVEDHATMALSSVEKLGEAIERARYVAAIEWLAAAQATDLRHAVQDTLGVGARDAYGLLRSQVAMLDEDRPLGPDIDRAQLLLREPLTTAA
jgi:histidine ammonia-lyase